MTTKHTHHSEIRTHDLKMNKFKPFRPCSLFKLKISIMIVIFLECLNNGPFHAKLSTGIFLKIVQEISVIETSRTLKI